MKESSRTVSRKFEQSSKRVQANQQQKSKPKERYVPADEDPEAWKNKRVPRRIIYEDDEKSNDSGDDIEETDNQEEEKPITVKLDKALVKKLSLINKKLEEISARQDKQEKIVDTILTDLFSSIGENVSVIKQESLLIHETIRDVLGQFSVLRSDLGEINFEDLIKKTLSGILTSISSIDNNSSDINTTATKVIEAFRRLRDG